MNLLRWIYVIFLVLVGLVGLLMSACGGFFTITNLLGVFQDLTHRSPDAWKGTLFLLLISIPSLLAGIAVVGTMRRLVKNVMARES